MLPSLAEAVAVETVVLLLLLALSLWYDEARKSMLRAEHMRANSARKAGFARMSLEWVMAKLWRSDWKTASWVESESALRVRSVAPCEV